ncbi:MAG: YceI family protein, partial [Actinomycetota bacterium]|nr:YceI family protein [Actinomycetota bacterium]
TTVLVVAIGAMAAYGVWRVLSAAPEEVSLDAAVAVVQEQESSRKDVENKPAHLDANQDVTSQPFSQDGVWRLDSETGTFSFEQSTGSFVGFRVKEELAKIGAVTAVGRTGQVDGELSIDEGKLQRVSVTADLSSLVTNESRRDRAARHALNVKENPTATFTLNQPLELPETDGSEVSLQANGQLTVNGISRDVVVELSAQLVENTIVVVGSTEVTFADYDVAVPSASIVVSAEDHGVVEFQLLFVRD